MPMSWRGGLVVVAAIGCGDSAVTQRDAGVCTTPPCEKTVGAYRLVGPPALDVLWVIDNSPGMGPLQEALATAFPQFVNVLETSESFSSVHVGVISGDVGAGPYELPGCSGFGDDGELQYAPRIPSCTPPNGRFLEDNLNADGTHTVNYTGTMADAFTCVSELGAQGCPFQQPLEAARRALVRDGASTGFLREEAYLAIFFVTASDDCSASDPSMFDPGNATLGPATPFRCFEHGVQCSPDAPRTAGTKTGCVSREASTLVAPVQSYVDAFKGLKEDPTKVIVGLIDGPDAPVTVDVATEPSLRAACSGGGITAAPAIRLSAFGDRFPNRSTESTACQSDLSGAVTQAAQTLRTVIGSPCLPSNVSVPAKCRVEEVRVDGVDEAVLVREIPQCDNEEAPHESSNRPCFDIAEDKVNCPAPEWAELTLRLQLISPPLADNIWIVTKCMVDSLP